MPNPFGSFLHQRHFHAIRVPVDYWEIENIPWRIIHFRWETF
jgi:hypothetical protein